jgi:hypothetical protein
VELSKNFVGSRSLRDCTIVAIVYTLYIRVSRSGGRSRASLTSISLIDLFLLLYTLILHIPALVLINYIPDDVNVLTMICFCIVCLRMLMRSRKKEVIIYSKSRVRRVLIMACL